MVPDIMLQSIEFIVLWGNCCMQFKLHFTLKDPLTLPVGYHSIVQGFIYQILSDNPLYSGFLHDHGYQAEGRQYKLFVFSLLQGRYEIHMPNITFFDSVSFEIRSPEENFCDILCQSILHTDIFVLNHQRIYLNSVEILKKKIISDQITIDMLSPLCVHTSYFDESGKRKTNYLSPVDPNFQFLLNENLRHKLGSFSSRLPNGMIRLKPFVLQDGQMPSRDKYVTRFHNHIIIIAWRGRYDLSGDPEDLTFLYDSGIGDRNSQGFGMFQMSNGITRQKGHE
ncbi:MAG: CRISPR-associated endoribonuclease Cas6 [Bilifractor sp.]